jgi:hypothetical protein
VHPWSAAAAPPCYVVAQARHRHLKRLVLAAVLGAVVAGYT